MRIFWYDICELVRFSIVYLTNEQQKNGFFYNINITIGTPPQTVSVNFDTGSSDLVVNSPSTAFCKSGGCIFGAYDTNKSSTATLVSKDLGQPVPISYLVGEAQGDWFTDDVEIAGQSISNFTVGVADLTSTLPQNILGMGYPAGGTNPANQSTAGAMVKAGLIKSASFSVYLNSLASSLGSVLFGGVDTSKFLGALHSYPIVPFANNEYLRLQINISSVSISGDKNVPSTTSDPITVMFDSGEFAINLPQDFVNKVWDTYHVEGVKISDNPPTTVGVCNCTLANSTSTLDVGFPGLNISVPFNSIVVEPSPLLLAAFNQTLPDGICLFNINGLDGREATLPFILGDSFLREVYYVVDLDSNEIALAPMNPNPGSSNILEIAAGMNGLASITSSASGTAAATPTNSGGSSSTSSTPSASSSKSAGSHAKGSSFVVMSGLWAFLNFLF